jgi:hypothetical protein
MLVTLEKEDKIKATLLVIMFDICLPFMIDLALIRYIPIGFNIIIRFCVYVYLKWKIFGEFTTYHARTRIFFGNNKVNFSPKVILTGFILPFKHIMYFKVLWVIICSICVVFTLQKLSEYKLKYSFAGLQLMESQTISFQIVLSR